MGDFERECQIRMLKACFVFEDTGIWNGSTYYPNCAWEMVELGLVTPSKKLTFAGRVALYLLGDCHDPLMAKSSRLYVISEERE